MYFLRNECKKFLFQKRPGAYYTEYGKSWWKWDFVNANPPVKDEYLAKSIKSIR